MIVLETARLRLRTWQQADREPFARMNADPRVMEFFPGVLSRAESDAFADRIEAYFNESGFGFFAVDLRDSGEFIGFTAALRHGFETLRFDEVVAFTGEANLRSRRVMEKIGMIREPADDFEHPGLPEGHPLRRHVLYRARTA